MEETKLKFDTAKLTTVLNYYIIIDESVVIQKMESDKELWDNILQIVAYKLVYFEKKGVYDLPLITTQEAQMLKPVLNRYFFAKPKEATGLDRNTLVNHGINLAILDYTLTTKQPVMYTDIDVLGRQYIPNYELYQAELSASSKVDASTTAPGAASKPYGLTKANKQNGLFNRGPIVFLIVLWILCCIYLLIYFIVQLMIFCHVIKPPQYQQTNGLFLNIFYYLFVAPIAAVLAFACVMLVVSITIFFIVLYAIWKIAKKIGLHHLLKPIPFFNELDSLGVFNFFESMEKVSASKASSSEKSSAASEALHSLLMPFLEIAYPDWYFDAEYLKEALNLLNPDASQESKEKSKEIVKSRMPIIKINFVDDFEKKVQTAQEKQNIDACIKENSSEIPKEASTIEVLKLSLENAIVKDECSRNYSIKNSIIKAKESITSKFNEYYDFISKSVAENEAAASSSLSASKSPSTQPASA